SYLHNFALSEVCPSALTRDRDSFGLSYGPLICHAIMKS
ncbi:MAG: hypothetical protein ACJA01_004223, partial [Saprospiraceae bacterium]